jgi:hypothetical protein
MPQNAKKTGPACGGGGGGVMSLGSLEANQVHVEVHGFCVCALPIYFSCLYTVPKASDTLAAAFSSLGTSTSTTEQRGPRLYTAPPLSRERQAAEERRKKAVSTSMGFLLLQYHYTYPHQTIDNTTQVLPVLSLQPLCLHRKPSASQNYPLPIDSAHIPAFRGGGPAVACRFESVVARLI